jgi:hypothetical protein
MGWNDQGSSLADCQAEDNTEKCAGAGAQQSATHTSIKASAVEEACAAGLPAPAAVFVRAAGIKAKPAGCSDRYHPATDRVIRKSSRNASPIPAGAKQKRNDDAAKRAGPTGSCGRRLKVAMETFVPLSLEVALCSPFARGCSGTGAVRRQRLSHCRQFRFGLGGRLAPLIL